MLRRALRKAGLILLYACSYTALVYAMGYRSGYEEGLLVIKQLIGG